MVGAPAYPAHGYVLFHLGIRVQHFTLGLDDCVASLNDNVRVCHDIGDPVPSYARIGRGGDESAIPIVDPNLYRTGFTGLPALGCNFGYNQGPEVEVDSYFLAYRTRLETDQDMYVGLRQDLLRRVDGQLRIARRTITLDQTVLLAKNISIFL